ncbi:OmpA family protein [Georgenia sp. H159]|uniref:OmpA family protein n=1 Tax=Georgenia sp. H159 TaxID=3076115 RepID=UPI002D79457A|nr:OmpA family protein [Georgenia sp. H159]
MRGRRLPVAVVMGAALMVASCSGGDEAPTPSDQTPAAVASPEPTALPTDVATAAPPGPRFPECEPADGRTVTMLDDVVIEAQKIPEVRTDEVELQGEAVPGVVVEETVIPERVAERGCIIEYEAPGGCLPAMEISGAYIPGYTLPERVLPEVTLPDGTVLEAVVLPAETVDEVVIEGVAVDEVCQLDDDPGSYVSGVYRNPLYRNPGYQNPSYQDPVYRSPVHVDGETVPGVSVPGVSAPGLSVPGESIPGAALEGYHLEGSDDVEVSTKEQEVYYTSEGDVLFGNNEDEIVPEAEAALEAVVADIASRGEPVKIRVEGHTDDVGTEEHNLDLSQRRAEAVAAWLTEQGGLEAAVVTTVGLGYEYPRADNGTEEGRAQNRRVVITVDLG